MATKFYVEDRYRIRNWGRNSDGESVWVVLFGHPAGFFSMVGAVNTHADAVARMDRHARKERS